MATTSTNPVLGATLDLPRCPHCGVDTPYMGKICEWQLNRTNRVWRFYNCAKCSNVVMAYAPRFDMPATNVFPSQQAIPTGLPEKAARFLSEAISIKCAPSSCIMACASAVDAMLKHKEYREGSLYKRIEKAAADHVITSDMAKWAHNIRLDANDERHADEAARTQRRKMLSAAWISFSR